MEHYTDARGPFNKSRKSIQLSERSLKHIFRYFCYFKMYVLKHKNSNTSQKEYFDWSTYIIQLMVCQNTN